MKKRALNPSAIKDFAECAYRFFIKHILNLDCRPYVDPKRELGTLVNAADDALELGEDLEAFMNEALKRIRTQPGYHSMYTPTLERLKLEAIKICLGGTWTNGKGKKMTSESYISWIARELSEQGSNLFDIQKRFMVDVGPVILAPQVDAVLEDEKEQLWPYERKLTARWDDENWRNRWALDIQTTIQAIAVEEEYQVEVPGIMIQAIQHSRQSRPKGEKKKMMPISKVERLPLKWVRKPRAIITHVRSWLEELGPELDQRESSSNWPLWGMASRSCDYCSLRKLCLGEIKQSQLRPRTQTEVSKWNQKRKSK